MTRLMVDLSLDEKERVLVALARATQVLGGTDNGRSDVINSSVSSSRGGVDPTVDEPEEPSDTSVEKLDPRAALLLLSDAILAGRFSVTRSDETVAQASPAQMVVYHGCPDCNRAKADTRFGPVEIEWGSLNNRAEESLVLSIPEEAEFERHNLAPGEVDAPNSSLLAQRVRHRDGLMCTAPGCENRSMVQAHHMDHRADGGPTTMENESTLCPICHAMEHADLLKVKGNATTGELTWSRHPRSPDVQLRDVPALCEKAIQLASAFHAADNRRGGESGRASGQANPECPDVGHSRPTRCVQTPDSPRQNVVSTRRTGRAKRGVQTPDTPSQTGVSRHRARRQPECPDAGQSWPIRGVQTPDKSVVI